MNWQRILRYILILWAVSFGVSFVFKAVTVVLQEAGSDIPVWLKLVRLVAMLAAVTAVFARLAYLQSEHPFVHALLVLLISTLIAFLTTPLSGQTALQWVLSNIIWFITAAAGVGLGVFLRRRSAAANHNTAETKVS